jgi:D-arabinose 5-phosphate isomerase GutQ
VATVLTHQVRLTWSSGSGGSTLTGTVSRTADGENNRLITMTASQTDLTVAFAAVYTNIKMFVAKSDQNATIKTNSTLGTDTITLAAGVPFFYADNANMTNPFTANITSLHLNNLAAAEALIDIKCLLDA